MWVAALLLILDQCLKAISLNYIRAWGTSSWFVFEWNTGTLMYSDWLGLLIMAALFLFMLRKVYDKKVRFDSWAILIAAGIGSNLIDGVHWNAVIDYIRLPWTSFCFNLADVYVLTGVGMLIWDKIGRRVKRV